MDGGWITIGTDLETKTFNKKYEQLKTRLKNEEINLEIKAGDLENAKRELQSTQQELSRVKKTQNEINEIIAKKQKQYNSLNSRISNGEALTSDEYIRFSSLDNSLTNLKDKQSQINKEYDLYNDKLNKSYDFLTKAEAKYDIQKNKVSEIRTEFTALQSEVNKADYSSIKNSIDDIGNSMKGAVKKATRWALAVFGIRSAYMFVRQAVSTLSQYNDQIATDISYIRFAIASILQPVIERIIQLVYKLLAYVGYLAKAWFNVDIFANASVKAFNKANKSASELKKTLAGFDEMNVLNDNGSVGALGGLPSTDLGDWKDVDIPEWLVWIKDHGKLIENILKLIGAAILTIKTNLGLLGLAGWLLVIEGLLNLIKDVKIYLDNPTWKNFANILRDISNILLGFGMIAGLTTPLGLILTIISQIVRIISIIPEHLSNIAKWLEMPTWNNFLDAVQTGVKVIPVLGDKIADLIENLKDENDATNDLINAEEKLKQARDELKDATDRYIRAVDNSEEAQKRLKEIVEKYKISEAELNKIIEIGTDNYAQLTDKQKEVYKAYKNNTDAQKELKDATDKMNETKKEEQKQSLYSKLKVLDEKGAYDEYKKAVVDAMDKGIIKSGEARDKLNYAMRDMSSSARNTFMNDIPNDIQEGLQPSKYESTFSKFKNAWNSFWSGLTTKIAVKATAEYSGTMPSATKHAKGGIAYYNPVKLASGAIINQPGRGVPLRGAIGGEAGAEGILPLTDEQQMELLGTSIGRHVNITANIPVYAYNRQVDRQIQKIKAEDDFAFNGR